MYRYNAFVVKYIGLIIIYLKFVATTTTISTTSHHPKEHMIHRIVNGQPAEIDEVPYLVSFKHRLEPFVYSSFCSGAIIKSDHIISAAHCFATSGTFWSKPKIKSDRNQYAVAGNIHNIAVLHKGFPVDGQWKKILKVWVPDDYVYPVMDISLVRTKTKFKFNSHVQPIAYARDYHDYKEMKCQISGYGQTVPSLRLKPSPIMLTALTNLLYVHECDLIHNKDMHSYICTDHQITSDSQGDSGGPLVCKGTGDPNENLFGVLVGITTGLSPNGKGTFFLRTSEVSQYLDKGASQRLYCDIILLNVLNVKILYDVLLY